MSLEALKRNGHNLELGDFELTGEYGIPVLRPEQLNQRFEWIRFNHALREPHRERYGVQFFIDDYLFQAEAEAITDEIKAYMGDEETMMAGSYKVTWKETVSRRVDTTALKKLLGDALDEYTKTITTRPFKVI